MKLIDSLLGRKVKRYIKAPLAGKIISVTSTEMVIENKVIKIHRPLVELGSTVKKGDIIAF